MLEHQSMMTGALLYALSEAVWVSQIHVIRGTHGAVFCRCCAALRYSGRFPLCSSKLLHDRAVAKFRPA